MLKVINALLAVVGGVGGIIVLFWLLNAATERLSPKWENRLKPYVFIGPAMLAVGIFLVYPALRTIYVSFLDARSENFVGLQNYTELAGDPALLSAVFNNLLWMIIVPTVSVALGLVIAVLADRMSGTGERISKSVIFLPMAISFVGASTIWLFVYAWVPASQEQFGLLNTIWSGLGGEPKVWLQISAGRLNTLLLIVIMIWLQAGFAMVLLSAAIKNVPEETLEAARIDGASEVQIFWRVIIPQVASTIAVVLTTILIGVLKTFDIVYVTTGGNFDTDLVAVRFITELFQFRQFGRAAAIVVVLMLATIPVMIYNIRQFRAQEAR
jgi:alpha-glucoside transport system permease protein